MTGPHDFTFVSGLAFLVAVSPTCLPLSPLACGRFGRMILRLPLVPHCLQSPVGALAA